MQYMRYGSLLRLHGHVSQGMSTVTAPTDRIDTMIAIRAFFKRLLFAPPAEQVGTSGTSASLGQVLDVSKAAEALELFTAGQDATAVVPSSHSSRSILSRCR